MPFRGGIKEAAKMLAGLDKSSRENVLKKKRNEMQQMK